MSERSFEHDAAARRYRLLMSGRPTGFVEYDLIGHDAMLIKHTEVDPAYEGQGHGGALVRHVLEDARAQGKSVLPICPYTIAFIRRHPEYLNLVREDYRAVVG